MKLTLAIISLGAVIISYFLHGYLQKNRHKVFPHQRGGDRIQLNQVDEFWLNNKHYMKILREIPRPDDRFTQGFGFIDDKGYLLESTGWNNMSFLMKIDMKNQEVIESFRLGDEYFGEGAEIIRLPNGTSFILYMTWRNGVMMIFDEHLNYQFSIPNPPEIREGWGICRFTDRENKDWLLITDGTSKIHYMDPVDFKVKKSVTVMKIGKGNSKTEKRYLNEIEQYGDLVLVNVFLSTKILLVEPISGEVIEEFDFFKLNQRVQSYTQNPHYTNNNNCLNGIAYDKKSEKLYITGKNWPLIFEV